MSGQPTRALIALLQRPEISADPQVLARDIGLEVVTATFGQCFGANPTEVTPEAALSAAPAYWRRYFTTGQVEVLTAVANHTSLRIAGPVVHPLVRSLIIGQLQRIAELTGVDDVEVQARPLPDAAWRFDVSWRLEEFDLDATIVDEVSPPSPRRTGTRPAARLSGVRSIPYVPR